MSPIRRSLVFSAIPHADESFGGYLSRLTDVNHYDAYAWILQLAKLGDYHQKESLAFEDDNDLTLLSRLTGVETTRLLALTYRRQGRKQNRFGDCLIFGLPVPRTAICMTPAKICPHCLRECG